MKGSAVARVGLILLLCSSAAAAQGIITTVAGTGAFGFNGDNQPATSAWLAQPPAVAVDSSGNLYMADEINSRIRRVDAVTGIITTVAGTGVAGFNGDNQPATSAMLSFPTGVTMDTSGNVYIADRGNTRIRRVDAVTGIITTVAGTGAFGFNGDNQPAINAQLRFPWGVAAHPSGDLYISDQENQRIRKVDVATGVITTVAGTGVAGFNGDDQLATSALLNFPYGVAVDSAGNLYVSDLGNQRVRRVDAATGIISTVAGTGTSGFNGDNQPATSAQLRSPRGVALDASGNLYIVADGRVRRVNAATGILTTVAGTGITGFNGDNQPATSARLNQANGVALDAGGNLYIADSGNHRIRKVSVNDTPTGSNVTVRPVDENGQGTPVALTFDNVVQPGDTTLTTTSAGPPVPTAFRLGNPPKYYDIITTAVFSGLVTVCISYGGATFANESALRLLHFGDNGWEDVTTSLDTGADIICGRVSSLSPFAVVGPADDSPPVIAPTVSGTLGNNGWYVSDVTVTWTVEDNESAISSTTGCDATSVTSDTAGVTFTCTATSAGGTASESVTIKRDAVNPSIALNAPADGATYLLNQSVAADYSCDDNLSGVALCAGPVPSGTAIDTSAEGSQSFTVNAEDNAGNLASTTNGYSVQYDFAEFQQPVENLPVINVAKAGRTIPIKWQLRDANGAYLSDLATFVSLLSAPITCDAAPSSVVEEEATTTGGTVLRYDSATNQFVYNWQTAKSWTGCRLLQLTLADGTQHYAKFNFK